MGLHPWLLHFFGGIRRSTLRRSVSFGGSAMRFNPWPFARSRASSRPGRGLPRRRIVLGFAFPQKFSSLTIGHAKGENKSVSVLIGSGPIAFTPSDDAISCQDPSAILTGYPHPPFLPRRCDIHLRPSDTFYLVCLPFYFDGSLLGMRACGDSTPEEFTGVYKLTHHWISDNATRQGSPPS